MKHSLNSIQVQSLVNAHCQRSVDAMSLEELRSYAFHSRVDEYDKTPGFGDTDVCFLMDDIFNDFDENDEEIEKFLCEIGLTSIQAQQMIAEVKNPENF